MKTTSHAGMWCSRPSQRWGSLVMRLNISSIKNTIPDLLVPARAGKHTQLQIVLSPIERKYLTGCTNPNYSGDKLAFSKLSNCCPGYYKYGFGPKPLKLTDWSEVSILSSADLTQWRHNEACHWIAASDPDHGQWSGMARRHLMPCLQCPGPPISPRHIQAIGWGKNCSHSVFCIMGNTGRCFRNCIQKNFTTWWAQTRQRVTSEWHLTAAIRSSRNNLHIQIHFKKPNFLTNFSDSVDRMYICVNFNSTKNFQHFMQYELHYSITF